MNADSTDHRGRNARKESDYLDLADVLEDELSGECLQRSEKCLTTSERRSLGPDKERLKALRAEFHARSLSALCLSGGGIRSASFALGVLQGLANKRVLSKFNYLSTVSGGGYIGGWLSAWIAQSGLDRVITELNKELVRPTEAGPTDAKPTSADSQDNSSDPESAPIRHLRRYSNYLTPKLGFTSADTWTLIATVVRNVFLNWLMLIPLLAAALMLPRLFVWVGISQMDRVTDSVICIVFLAAILLTAVITACSAGDLPKWRAVDDKGRAKGFSKITEGRYLWLCVLPMVMTAALLSLGWFWLCAKSRPTATEFSTWGWPWPLWSPNATWFILAIFVGSTLGGLVAMVALGKLTLIKWKEWGAMVVTAAVGGVGLWWVFTWLFARMEPYVNDATRLSYFCFAPSLVMLVFLLMNFSYVGTFSTTTSEDREWWARSAGWILIVALAWAALNALAIWGPIGIKLLFNGFAHNKDWIKFVVAAFGGASGIVTALFGHSAATKAAPKKDANPKSGIWLTAGALFFIIFLLVCIALGTSWVLAKLLGFSTIDPASYDFRAFYPTSVVVYPGCHLWWLLFGFLAIGWTIGKLINVNQFSLHAMYRARLIRAYLGASRGETRRPHWFTGFDPNDNIDMHKLKTSSPPQLFHVVNTALNLVSGEDLAWQERMAQSFTISPLHSGSWRMGYRPSEKYALGIGLGTAITISGAAANPNMGYHSSPLVTFLMTLFNVRLGWWVANPRECKKKVWQSPGPLHAARPLISEAFGQTTSEFKYINLSDGGHFENLGLYEMVLRRCRYIVVIDAGRDTEYAFEDLGNAIRKIRIDLGIDINITINYIAPDKDEAHLARCAVGDILYNKVDETALTGKLLYIKPVLRQNEPVDVYNYHKAHPGFPHETTNDQWFSESQLESYRMLGAYTIQDMCGDIAAFNSVKDFITHAEEVCAIHGQNRNGTDANRPLTTTTSPPRDRA